MDNVVHFRWSGRHHCDDNPVRQVDNLLRRLADPAGFNANLARRIILTDAYFAIFGFNNRIFGLPANAQFLGIAGAQRQCLDELAVYADFGRPGARLGSEEPLIGKKAE
ncbi:hypothetical protein SATMO3_36350 [Sporomusa aerivorans]